MPIPYAKSIKIVYKGNDLKFHQIQYRELSGKEKVKSFHGAILIIRCYYLK